MDDFLRAVRGEDHALADGNDGLRALLLADAAERSRRTGRRVELRG
jgi:predicted dehydrogenase